MERMQRAVEDIAIGVREAYYATAHAPEIAGRILESYRIVLAELGYEHPDVMDRDTHPRRRARVDLTPPPGA